MDYRDQLLEVVIQECEENRGPAENSLHMNQTQRMLQWVAEKPTKPGWYWFKPTETQEVEVLHVIGDRDGLQAFAAGREFPEFLTRQKWMDDIEWSSDLQMRAGEWAGPIEPPHNLDCP